MFLFEKSLIGAYCNRSYDLKKDSVLFHAKAELKQTAQAKILMSGILIRKRAHQIVEHAYRQTAHFFMSQNDHHLGDAINFDYVSSPPFSTFLKITNSSLCDRSFFFSILPVFINKPT